MMNTVETTDIQTTKPGIEQAKTLDQILASKITDKTTLDTAKSVFAEVQKRFSQSINDYVDGLDEWSISNIIGTESDPIKYLMEDIDVKMGMPAISTISSTADTLLENKNTSEATADLATSWKATKEAYDKLDPKNQISDEQLQKEKKNIPQNIIDIVNTKIQGTNFTTDEFLKFYIIGENKENKDKPEYQDFLSKYAELRELVIPENTTLGNMGNPNEAHTVAILNPDLSNFVDTSPRLDKIATPPLPEIKDLDQEFEMYVKFIPDQDIREHVMKNQKIILAYKKSVDEKKTPDEKDKAAYEEYLAAISTVKESLPQSTQTMLKQRVMGSCISGLVRYFDTTTINEDNFADDFTLKTNTEGFSIGKGEKQYNEQGDDILCINGNIKGNTIGFYYNLNNPDAQLKSEDYLHYNKENNEFAFGVKGGGKRELGVKLPTISMLSEQAQLVSEKYFAELLETSGNREELSNALKQKVSERLLQNYTQEALIKSRVERDVEKNITTQTLHHDFIPDTVLARLNEDSNINSVSEKQARELMQIRDKSTEHMRSDQLRTLRNIMTRLDPIRKQELPRLEAKRETLFADMKKEGTAVTASLTFWQRFSKNGEIQVQDLETFVTSLEKKESIGSNIHKFSPEFQTAEEQGNADALLNADIW